MADQSMTTIVDGRYFWQLVFDYDNSGNSGEIKHEYRFKKRKVVTSKDFLSRRFEIKTGFSYGGKQSASITFEGLGDFGASVEYNFHIDTAYELQNTHENSTTIETEHEETRSYTVGANSKAKLYQLHYNTDGVQIATDIFASDPKPDTIVKLRFSCKKYILGLDDLLQLFSRIFPGSDNKDEWSLIRETILTNLSRPQDDQFKSLLNCLENIRPGTDNLDEWALIRKTCEEIKAEIESQDHQVLFNKLLRRLSTISPGTANIDEWTKIRELSNGILKDMKQSF